MRVLVTGGAGFIGSHTVEALLAAGYQPAVLDNLSRGRRENLPAGIEFYQGDVRDAQTLGRVVEQFQPRAVIHLAAQVDVQTSLGRPDEDMAVNIGGTINLLEACRQYGVDKVVYASSAAVYGDPQYLPVDERHPLRPLSPYGISKHTAEHYLEAYRAVYGVNYVVLRYANVYGPRQDATGEGGVVAIFVDRVRRGQAPVIFGDGEQTRDFIYVRDVAAANLAALRRGDGLVANISTGRATSVSQLYQLFRGLVPAAPPARYAPPRPGDIQHSVLDCRLANKELAWQAAYSLPAGLQDMFMNMKQLNAGKMT
ncbi:MAG: NAD-dependent epimerase/dehydratase family protein [Desulfurispora sp.]|uniref:NAD-dependent epimerase/dehydratase family protein n=1 Tax=Desulfurispora sp. TaxID=3014275 RepID=UPI00404B66A3